jgi:hypothetical protein
MGKTRASPGDDCRRPRTLIRKLHLLQRVRQTLVDELDNAALQPLIGSRIE